MNYCRDCKHYGLPLDWHTDHAYCAHPKCASPVDGSVLPVRLARMEVCNNEQKEPQFWQAK